jgi:flavorubredoxin
MPDPFTVAGDTWVIPLTLPAGRDGVLPLNPLLIRGQQPLLADTGPAVLRGELLDAVFSLVDPADLRWVFLSHDDRDHAGNLLALLDLCPAARLVTSSQGLMRLAKEWAFSPDRVVVLGEGERLDIGDRQVTSLRPPLFDSPATRGLHDTRTGLYYGVDSFAALLPEYYRGAGDVPTSLYEAGFAWLNRANAPWYALTDPVRLGREVSRVRRLDPPVIVSYHGPPAHGMTGRLCDLLEAMPREDDIRFPGLEELMRSLDATR